MKTFLIAKISPLYDYWESDQNVEDELKRLQKANKDNPMSVLFEKEPYKWENLYQSIVREIIRGDYDSLKGLNIILNTLVDAEKNRILQAFVINDVLNKRQIDELIHNKFAKYETKRKPFRFLRILYAIFLNPYQLKIRGPKNHIYEKTGFIMLYIRNAIVFKNNSSL